MPATVTTSVIVTPVSSPGVILVNASLVVPLELPAMASWSDVFALVSTFVSVSLPTEHHIAFHCDTDWVKYRNVGGSNGRNAVSWRNPMLRRHP